jgi:hypothetical protein
MVTSPEGSHEPRNPMRRRTPIRTLAGGAAVVIVEDSFAEVQSGVRQGQALLGFKHYGMKKIPVGEAISDIAKIGYTALSLTLRPTWDTEPRVLSKTDWAEIRKQIGDLGPVLSSVMKSLRLVGPNTNRKSNLERQRAAAAVARELSPGAPAVIEATLGGRPEACEETKRQMADELSVWAKTLEPLKTTPAMEGHVGNAGIAPRKCCGCWTR